MLISELSDFDVFVDEDEYGLFSYRYVFIVDWAYKRGYLDISFLGEKVFRDGYQKMINGDVTMEDFVYTALDGELLDTYFSERVRDFIEFYYMGGNDGHDMNSNLTECYGSAFPDIHSKYNECNQSQLERFYQLIDAAKSYYKEEIIPILNDGAPLVINGSVIEDEEAYFNEEVVTGLIAKIEYFEDYVDSKTQGVCEDFSHLFVFMIDWAKQRGQLANDFVESRIFIINYEKLKNREISMTEFALDVLDGKLLDRYFLDQAKGFIENYFLGRSELSIYGDIRKAYSQNSIIVAHDFDNSEKLYKLIDLAYSSYKG